MRDDNFEYFNGGRGKICITLR